MVRVACRAASTGASMPSGNRVTLMGPRPATLTVLETGPTRRPPLLAAPAVGSSGLKATVAHTAGVSLPVLMAGVRVAFQPPAVVPRHGQDEQMAGTDAGGVAMALDPMAGVPAATRRAGML